MRGIKRFLAALVLGIYIITTLSTSIVFAQEDGILPNAQEELETTIEVVGDEQDVVEVNDEVDLDPSMFIDAEINDDETSSETEDYIDNGVPPIGGEDSDEDVPIEEMPELSEDQNDTLENVIPETEVVEESESEEVVEGEIEGEVVQEPINEEKTEVAEEVEEEVEVELEGLFNCDGNHYETKSKNVSYYDKATKGRKKKGTIASKGTVVKVVDTKYSGVWLLSDKYYKLSTGYWVLADNIKSHDCTEGKRTTTYKRSQRSGDNKNHNVVKSVSAQKCTKCSCVMKKATSDTSKEKHSGWYSTGYCGVCGYKFKISEKSMTKANYMVKGDLYLRTEPYDAASTKGGKLSKGTIISLNKKADNAHGNQWYKTTDGGWVYSGNVTKHDHSYSSSTGKCSCGKMFDYEKNSMSNTAYQTKSGSVSAYQHPYTGSTLKKTYSSSNVFYVNAYSYSDPDGWWLAKGDKWFRTTDGFWVLSSKVKEHTKKEHKYSATSTGKCTFSGCTNEFALDVKWIHSLNHNADVYETKGTNKVARVKPYSNATAKHTYGYKYQIVMVDRYVKENANGEKWYRTTSGYWIKATDIQAHSHRLSVGSCSSVDCGYVTNMGLKSMSSKVYETTSNNVLVKDKPFDDAGTNRTLAKAKSIKVNGYTTKLDEKWFRTTDNKYVKACYIKEHKHSYTNGYCSVCGQYAEYTTQSINPKIVETSKAGVTIWDKPYEKSKVKRTIPSKGEKIVVTEQATNYYKNIWYRVSTGGWVYSSNVKTPSGGEIKTSNKAKVQDYIITVTDNKNRPITDAYVEWLGETYKANEKGNIELVYVTDKTEFTISAPKYDSVTKKDYKMNSNRRDTVVLAVSGSFEASNVNMTYVDETTDLLRSARSINHYHTQGFFNEELITIKCVMGSTNGVGTYKLVQKGKTIATSTDGTFKNLTVKSFEPKKTVSLQIFDTAGTKRSEQTLLLNVFNEGPGNVGSSLELGGASLGFAIDEDFPIIGGLSVNFDLPKGIPFGIDVGDESTKYALNFQIPTSSGGDKKTFKGEYTKFWKEAKELTTTNWKQLYNKKAIDNIKDKAAWKGKLRVGGYAEKIHGQPTIKGKLFVEGSIKLENYFQTTLGPVPVIFEIEIEGKITPSGQFVITNYKDISGLKLALDLAASIEGSAGVGLKYVASVSAYGKATLKVEGELIPDPALNDIYMFGNFGAKVKVLDMEIVNWKVFETPTLYIVQDGKFVLWDENSPTLAEVMTDENNYTSVNRRYLEYRSEWYTDESLGLMEEDGTDQEISIVVSDFDFDVLQSSTYTDIKPQVVTADGTIMMVYNDDNETRGDLDKSILVYSLYNPESKEWSVPVPVYDDTTADYGFSVCNSNDEIYIVWQNAKSLNETDATLTSISKNTELMVAKYDVAMGSFQNIEQVTNNEKYEVMPRIASVNGKTIVTWYTNSDDSVFVTSGTNTVEYAYKLDENYAPRQDYIVDTSDMTDEELEEEVLPSEDDENEIEEETETPTAWTYGSLDAITTPITSLAVGYMIDDGYIAYTTDGDGNTTTVDDQNIWLYDTQTNVLTEYTDKASNVEFTDVHGDRAMTWYNQGMIYYALDTETAPQQLYTEETLLGDEYHIISDENGNMAILFSVPKDESSDAHIMLYDNETFEWGLPIAVTNQDKYIENFNGAYSDGIIVSIFNQTQITDEEMNETNNLCSAVIGERHDIAISNASFKDFELQAGAKKPLSVDVKNNGTVRISNFTITVYNGEEVVSQQTVERTLKTGETTNVELEITLPEILEKTTYFIEIEETNYDDAYVADNSQELTIGRAALMVKAENSPTDTENIIVVSVENNGYEPSGGMVALFDDNNQVKEVLVENFDPINHGESYTCAIKLNDEYFEGASGKTFNIGVVPSEEQDIDAYNIVTIYVDNINHDNLPDIDVNNLNVVETVDSEELSLMEETTKTIAGKVKNDSENDIENAKICVLTYDDRGIYLGMKYLDTVSLAAGEEKEFIAEFDTIENIAIIKIVLVNNDNLEPLTSAIEIRILDDLTDDDAGIDESEDYEAIIEEEE